jgi:hypothetical protein
VTTLAPVALIAWLVLLGALVLARAELMKRYARNALADEGVWTQLAAHSCRSSSGLGPSLAFMDRTGFLFALAGTVMRSELAPAWYAAHAPAWHAAQKTKCRRRTRRPAVPCLNQAEARRFSAKPLLLEAPHIMAARGAAVPVRRRGESETGETPVLPRNDVAASSAVQVPLRDLDIPER